LGEPSCGRLAKKRTTRKFCAKAAHVFTVWIWNRCFGQTDSFPAIVDPAIVGPTVLSSKRAEVDVESVMPITARPFAMVVEVEVMGGFTNPSMFSAQPWLLRPMTMLKLSLLLLSAQIGDFVALLSERIAAASHNNRRNPQCPGIPQLTKHVHISSFPPVKSWCRDWQSTSGTTRAL
jgi:hypothetical protein